MEVVDWKHALFPPAWPLFPVVHTLLFHFTLYHCFRWGNQRSQYMGMIAIWVVRVSHCDKEGAPHKSREPWHMSIVELTIRVVSHLTPGTPVTPGCHWPLVSRKSRVFLVWSARELNQKPKASRRNRHCHICTCSFTFLWVLIKAFLFTESLTGYIHIFEIDKNKLPTFRT